MHWSVVQGDILDIPADVLVCSANVFLNLSGGVGGALLLRYGPAMQQELHQYLSDRSRRFVPQGEIVRVSPCGSPYRAVFHAVAVNGAYQSSPEIVGAIVRRCLEMAAAEQARIVALTALATGYGNLSLGQFAIGIEPILRENFSPIERVLIGTRKAEDCLEISRALGIQ